MDCTSGEVNTPGSGRRRETALSLSRSSGKEFKGNEWDLTSTLPFIFMMMTSNGNSVFLRNRSIRQAMLLDPGRTELMAH